MFFIALMLAVVSPRHIFGVWRKQAYNKNFTLNVLKGNSGQSSNYSLAFYQQLLINTLTFQLLDKQQQTLSLQIKFFNTSSPIKDIKAIEKYHNTTVRYVLQDLKQKTTVQGQSAFNVRTFKNNSLIIQDRDGKIEILFSQETSSKTSPVIIVQSFVFGLLFFVLYMFAWPSSLHLLKRSKIRVFLTDILFLQILTISLEPTSLDNVLISYFISVLIIMQMCLRWKNYDIEFQKYLLIVIGYWMVICSGLLKFADTPYFIMAFFASEFISILFNNNYKLKNSSYILIEAVTFDLLIIVWIIWSIPDYEMQKQPYISNKFFISCYCINVAISLINYCGGVALAKRRLFTYIRRMWLSYNDSQDKQICYICYRYLQPVDNGMNGEESQIATAKCNHVFHAKCIEKQWEELQICPWILCP